MLDGLFDFPDELPVNLRALRVFVGVMEDGTLTRTSQRMNLSQSAASRLLSLLEEELGAPLFARERRRLLPTPQAEALHLEAQRILAQVAALRDIAAGDGAAAPLRVICQSRLANGLVVPALAAFIACRPGTAIHLETAPRRELVRRIASGRYDLAVATLPLAVDRAAPVHLGSVPLGILLPQGHPLAGADALDVGDFGGVPYIALDETTLIRRMVDDALAATGDQLRADHQTSTGSAAYRLVAEGLGFTFADRVALDPEIAGRTALVPWRRKVEVSVGALELGDDRSGRHALVDILRQVLVARSADNHTGHKSA